MPRKDYQARLEELEDDVLYMSELVRDRLRKGLSTLETKNPELAEDVITGDHEINELYLTLEQDCIDLLALQQPVAGDLRFIASSFKIITDLERIGDLATNLAEYSLDARRDRYPDVDVQAIGDFAEQMLEDAMRAYAERDVELCYELADRDNDLDEECAAASEAVVMGLLEQEFDAMNQEDEAIEEVLQDVSRLLLTIRDLERVGDHAVNISARTVYMIESDDELIY